MYRRPKFLEVLLEIRREMAREVDYDVDLFVEAARQGQVQSNGKASVEFQTEAEPLAIDAETLTVSGSSSGIRKGQ